MKKKIIRYSSIVCILLITVLLLSFLQQLLMPKYVSSLREGALIREYYRETTAHDVLFVGDCEVYESFTPPTLWEEYGITSYIRGSAQQLSWQSYYLLEEMLEREAPKVVVFNVLSLKYGTPQEEAYNRMTLDGMAWSFSKWNAVKASMTEGESVASYLFPLLRFHSRWKELTFEDWQYSIAKPPAVSHNGYLMQTTVKGGHSDRIGTPLADYTLPETSMEYLDAMRRLCQEKGVVLVLIKAPTNDWKYYWYEEWDRQIADYASANGLSYYNFIPLCEEIGIDWSTDTYDAGVHLNVYGAEKLTSYFGALLQSEFSMEDHRADPALSKIWNTKVDTYYKERNQ